LHLNFFKNPHSLKDSNVNLKVKVVEEGVGVRSLICSASRVEWHARIPGWGLGRVTSESIIHTNLHYKLVCAWFLRAFQWYIELFHLMNFDPWNISLKIQNSVVIPTPTMGVHLDVWVHSFTPPQVQMWLSSCIFDLHLSTLLLWSRSQGQGRDIKYLILKHTQLPCCLPFITTPCINPLIKFLHIVTKTLPKKSYH